MLQYNWTESTTSEEAVEALRSEIAGKSVLITGISPNGIGSETAIQISAALPSLLILASRTPGSVAAVTSQIVAKNPNIEVRQLHLNLSSLDAVREAADEVLSWGIEIDVLVNNAGIMGGSFRETVDGFESQFAINYLSHWLLTNRLLPILAPSGRVINVSSNGHSRSNILYDKRGRLAPPEYEQFKAYGQGKTANMLFSIELARRGIISFSLHPGVVPTTRLPRNMKKEDFDELLNAIKIKGMSLKNLSQGAATTIVTAFQPGLGVHNGKFFRDGHASEPLEAYAGDPENAKRLWKFTEELVGERFDF